MPPLPRRARTELIEIKPEKPKWQDYAQIMAAERKPHRSAALGNTGVVLDERGDLIPRIRWPMAAPLDGEGQDAAF